MTVDNFDRTANARRGNRARGVETRHEIVEAAIDLVARHGSRGVSLGEIAEAAGVSKAGLLHHFPSKESLLQAALDVRDQLDLHVSPTYAAVGLEVFEDVEKMVRGWTDRPASLGLFTELLAENLNPEDPLHSRLVARAERVRSNLERALDRGKERGQIRDDADSGVIAHSVIAFVNGLETYWQLDPRIPIVEIAAEWRATMVRAYSSPDAQA